LRDRWTICHESAALQRTRGELFGGKFISSLFAECRVETSMIADRGTGSVSTIIRSAPLCALSILAAIEKMRKGMQRLYFALF